MPEGSSFELPEQERIEALLDKMLEAQLGHLALIWELIHEEGNNEP